MRALCRNPPERAELLRPMTGRAAHRAASSVSRSLEHLLPAGNSAWLRSLQSSQGSSASSHAEPKPLRAHCGRQSPGRENHSLFAVIRRGRRDGSFGQRRRLASAASGLGEGSWLRASWQVCDRCVRRLSGRLPACAIVTNVTSHYFYYATFARYEQIR